MEFKSVLIGMSVEQSIISSFRKNEGLILVDDIKKHTQAFDNDKAFAITNKVRDSQTLPEIDEKEIKKYKKERETFARLKKQRKKKKK